MSADFIPSAQEMEQQIRNQQLTVPVSNSANTTYLANAENQTAGPDLQTSAIDAWLILRRQVNKILAIGLTLQSLYGIYKSIYFIFITYPELGILLTSHQITQAQVNDYLIKAIMMAISTLMSMFFAMHFAVLKTKAAKTISVILGILLMVGNAAIHDYFQALRASDYILAMINRIFFR